MLYDLRNTLRNFRTFFLSCFAIISKLKPPALVFWVFWLVFPWICPFFFDLRLLPDLFPVLLCHNVQIETSCSCFLGLLMKNFLNMSNFLLPELKAVCKFVCIINDGKKIPAPGTTTTKCGVFTNSSILSWHCPKLFLMIYCI